MVILRICVDMAFRNHKFKPVIENTGPVMESSRYIVNDDSSLSLVSVVDDNNNNPMPEPEEYTLDKLINAGVPLDTVKSNLLSSDAVFNSLIDEVVDNNDNSDNSDEN